MHQALLVGQILRSRYQITQSLGSGGFGDTYLAQDLDLPGKPYCVVKHLKPKSNNPAVLSVAKTLFDREAETLYQLGNDSDRIPKLFAHFEESSEFYLVQEFIDGHDLSKEIVPGQIKPETVVCKLLQDILEVLSFVHQKGVIHRDIKPQNLMRRRKDGKIVLIDFGAVKEIGTLLINPQGETSISVAIGSPGYMPNEQSNGRPKFASDVYAVGMMGIQALTGFLPQQLQEDPETGETIWRDYAQISDALGQVLETMVRDHFSQRYQNAGAALEALMPISKVPIAVATTQPSFSPAPISPKLAPDIASGLLPLPSPALVPLSSLEQGNSANINRSFKSPKPSLSWWGWLIPVGLLGAIAAVASAIWWLRNPLNTSSPSPQPENTGKVLNAAPQPFEFYRITQEVPWKPISQGAYPTISPDNYIKVLRATSSSDGGRIRVLACFPHATPANTKLNRQYTLALGLMEKADLQQSASRISLKELKSECVNALSD